MMFCRIIVLTVGSSVRATTTKSAMSPVTMYWTF